MKILYVYTALLTQGGVDRVLTVKANYLAERLGHDVWVVTDSQCGRPLVFPLSPRVHHIDLQTDFDEQYHHGILRRYGIYRRLMRQYRQRLEALLMEVRPDIVCTTLGREMDFLTDIGDGSCKVGESHIAKPFCRNLHLMEARGFPYNIVARLWRRRLEKSVARLDDLVVLTERDADNNPLIRHYGEYFKRLISKNNDIGYLNSILQDVLKRKRSQDVNAFLFSIENVEQLRSLREVDRNIYSYNTLLRNDSQRKLIFMYFYAAIIYYIACGMKARNYEMPKQIYFSGTGSKILNILGSKEQVTEFTQLILERVFDKQYTERFAIKIEQQSPKQITCRGGIKLESLRMDGNVDVRQLTPRNINAMKYCYSMLGDEPLTIKSVYDIGTRDRIIEQVKTFNEFFIALCDNVTKDEFGIENNVFKVFTGVLSDDVGNYLTAGINSYLKGRYEGDENIEDVPFFYPVIGIIRHNLLKNLCNEVISRMPL